LKWLVARCEVVEEENVDGFLRKATVPSKEVERTGKLHSHNIT
jgi:hypothetical protein